MKRSNPQLRVLQRLRGQHGLVGGVCAAVVLAATLLPLAHNVAHDVADHVHRAILNAGDHRFDSDLHELADLHHGHEHQHGDHHDHGADSESVDHEHGEEAMEHGGVAVLPGAVLLPITVDIPPPDLGELAPASRRGGDASLLPPPRGPPV